MHPHAPLKRSAEVDACSQLAPHASQHSFGRGLSLTRFARVAQRCRRVRRWPPGLRAAAAYTAGAPHVWQHPVGSARERGGGRQRVCVRAHAGVKSVVGDKSHCPQKQSQPIGIETEQLLLLPRWKRPRAHGKRCRCWGGGGCGRRGGTAGRRNCGDAGASLQGILEARLFISARISRRVGRRPRH